jgi:predicted component of type VI protein secretion system
MTLTLTITKHPELPPAKAMSRTFERCNAVIGRGTDSDWTLPDPERHLSKQHCRSRSAGDRYIWSTQQERRLRQRIDRAPCAREHGRTAGPATA